jgi:hypothetical protein
MKKPVNPGSKQPFRKRLHPKAFQRKVDTRIRATPINYFSFKKKKKLSKTIFIKYTYYG